jgi:TonB family protein
MFGLWAASASFVLFFAVAGYLAVRMSQQGEVANRQLAARDARIRQLENQLERIREQPSPPRPQPDLSRQLAEREARIRELENQLVRIRKQPSPPRPQPDLSRQLATRELRIELENPLGVGSGKGGGVYRVGGGVTAPALLFKVDPEYSEEARKAKYQGAVLLNIEVDPSGKVTNIKVQRSLGLGLDEKAIEAVRKWQFKPGYKDGKPVTVAVTIEVDFRLQ